MEAFQKQMKESELFLERIQATSGVDLAKLSYSRFSENNNYDVYEPVRFSWDDAKALDQIDVDGGVSGGSTDKKRNKKNGSKSDNARILVFSVFPKGISKVCFLFVGGRSGGRGGESWKGLLNTFGKALAPCAWWPRRLGS